MARVPRSVQPGMNLAGGPQPGIQPSGQPGLAQSLSQSLSPQYDLFQIPRYTPGQLGTLEQLTQQGQQNLPNLGNLSFDPIQKYAESQFQEDVLPQIYGGFSGRSGGQLGYGSGLLKAAEKARSNLQLGLAGQRSQFELAKHGALLKQLDLGLRSPYETAFAPRTPAPPTGAELFKQQLGQAAGSAAGQYGVEALAYGGKKLADWLSSPQASGIPQDSANIIKNATENNQWPNLIKQGAVGAASWAPAVAGTVAKVGIAGALGLGIPLAAIGIAYGLYRAIEGSSGSKKKKHKHRRRV